MYWIAYLFSFLKTKRKNSLTNQGTSEGPEASVLGGLTRRIWFCLVEFCLDGIWKVILKKEVKMDHTKQLDQADLDPPCQELLVRDLGFVVALLFCSVFFVCIYWRSNLAVIFPKDCYWPSTESTKKEKSLFLQCSAVLHRRNTPSGSDGKTSFDTRSGRQQLNE